MVIEFLFWLVDQAVGLINDLIPEVPDSIMGPVEDSIAGVGSIAAGIPASGALVPWGAIGTSITVLTTGFAASWTILTTRRVLAWIRSRGTSSE